MALPPHSWLPLSPLETNTLAPSAVIVAKYWSSVFSCPDDNAVSHSPRLIETWVMLTPPCKSLITRWNVVSRLALLSDWAA